MPVKTRIAVPEQVARDTVIEIKTLASHPMDSGFRRDSSGKLIPRDILVRFECRFDGQSVFAMDLKPAIAANPYISFFLRVKSSGAITFLWLDQHGNETREQRDIVVV